MMNERMILGKDNSPLMNDEWMNDFGKGQFSLNEWLNDWITWAIPNVM